MEIRPSHFLYGGEVDVTAHYGSGTRMGRLSIRKVDGLYQAYVHWYSTKEDEIICHSNSLEYVVSVTNREGNADDIVGEDDGNEYD